MPLSLPDDPADAEACSRDTRAQGIFADLHVIVQWWSSRARRYQVGRFYVVVKLGTVPS